MSVYPGALYSHPAELIYINVGNKILQNILFYNRPDLSQKES